MRVEVIDGGVCPAGDVESVIQPMEQPEGQAKYVLMCAKQSKASLADQVRPLKLAYISDLPLSSRIASPLAMHSHELWSESNRQHITVVMFHEHVRDKHLRRNSACPKYALQLHIRQHIFFPFRSSVALCNKKGSTASDDANASCA